MGGFFCYVKSDRGEMVSGKLNRKQVAAPDIGVVVAAGNFE